MRLATRTGLAAFAAATLSLLLIGVLLQGIVTRILINRIDAQLEERAESAPILAAVAERLSQSELSGTIPGARVLADGRLTELGSLPDDPLQSKIEPGWSTVGADGQRWRLHTIEVVDVPRVGDEALVQLVAPLGRVDSQARRLRQRAWAIGVLAAMGAGVVAYGFGSVASRPITALRRDTDLLDDAKPDQWRVARAYGTPEVDGVASTLNTTLSRLATETERRGAALEAARAFASSATHELRVPLQGVLTNLNLAASGKLGPEDQADVIERATEQVERMATALSAVRALAEAEFADPSWFEPTDLVELIDAAVAAETRRSDTPVTITNSTPEPAATTPPWVWPDGVSLALANVVRNALLHGRPVDGSAARIEVQINGTDVVVDDNGPGIDADDRSRLLDRFEQGPGARGAGLGLAIARQVTKAHGGSIEIGDSPGGGTRVRLSFGPPAPVVSPPPPTAE